MRALIGLGNPGPEYRDSKHNIGFAVLDRLAKRVVLKNEYYEGKALVARAQTTNRERHELLLAKPLTYMNLSGTAVRHLVQKQELALDEILVIYDDMDLELGRIRLKPTGGSGGHRGMRSIIRMLGSDEFPRLRCGIGHPEPDTAEVIDYVLPPFRKADADIVDRMIDDAVDAALAFITEGLEEAMNEYNRRGTSA